MPAGRMVVALGAALAVALAATSALPATAAVAAGPDLEDRTRPVLRLTFDRLPRGLLLEGEVPVRGGEVAVRTVHARGGALVVTPRGGGHGRALRLPGLDDRVDGPRAVLAVTDADPLDGDALAPGLADFRFGADVRVDAQSVGERYDNGNNVVQRGLFGTAAQYKLQVDLVAGELRPSCLLATTDAAGVERRAWLVSRAVVSPEHWYRLACARTGDEVRLVVTALASDGTPSERTVDRARGIPAIDLRWSDDEPPVPLTVGGKVAADGSVATESDQLNGAVDAVLLVVG